MGLRTNNSILIVEDSDEDFFITQKAFKDSHFANPIFRCTNGDDALDFLYGRGAYHSVQGVHHPALILLDLNMPGTDGREVLATIKADTSLQSIPVIIFTTSDMEQDILSCYEVGASSYIHKPVSINGFMEAIKRLHGYWFELVLLPGEKRK
nr:response regulator [Desulfobulbaceae bacterium]